MFAMHYDIRLPRDYDMQVIRHRIATRGPALDDLPGLGLKAYLVRDVASGADLNSYSPLYLWTDHDAAARFLWRGGGFAGIVRDFTRPPVRTWLGGGYRTGPALKTPTRAVVETVALDATDPLEDVVAQAGRRTDEVAGAASTHCAAYLIDPQRWELTFVTLGTDEVDRRIGPQTFELLHLSAPGIDELR